MRPARPPIPNPPGLKSKAFLTMARISASDLTPVPYVSTNTDSGSATAIEYDTCTRHLHRVVAGEREEHSGTAAHGPTM